jgi:hypothetical protein
MKYHLTPEEFDKLTKRYAITEDPDDLGCVPTLTPQKERFELEIDKNQAVSDCSYSEVVAEQLLDFLKMVNESDKAKLS